MVTFKSINLLKSKKRETPENGLGNMTIEEHKKFKNNKLRKVNLKTAVPLNNLFLDGHNNSFLKELSSPLSLFKPDTRFSRKRASSEVEAAAIKVQKAYKGYRTRRSLADCAVVVEELWWKALDFAALKQSSVSFFESDKSETAVSRWARARTRVAKVGKGLSKYEKAQKLVLRHWLEAIDPRHRYGHNLHFYYGIWFDSESSQPFFYWLDIGDGKEVNLEQCPRTDLQHQCITYLGPKEREAYEVIVKSGKLVYKQSGIVVDTPEGTKWIFVLSTSRNLYVGEKQKGLFQHSSFLAGGATIAAGRLVAYNGVLEAIWAYSGHYRPTEENFMEFINFLEEQHLDLAHVKKFPIDDDIPPTNKVTKPELDDKAITINVESTKLNRQAIDTSNSNDHQEDSSLKGNQEASKSDMSKNLSKKWSSGAGPRIGCVREYPTELQVKALEQVNLSPRSNWQRLINVSNSPIPSARPSPKVHLSPKLAYMGLPSPNTNQY